MVKKYAPKKGERVRDTFERADRAAERVNNLSDEEGVRFRRELEWGIAKINKHSYEVNVGQARELARQEALGWRYRG